MREGRAESVSFRRDGIETAVGTKRYGMGDTNLREVGGGRSCPHRPRLAALFPPTHHILLFLS